MHLTIAAHRSLHRTAKPCVKPRPIPRAMLSVVRGAVRRWGKALQPWERNFVLIHLSDNIVGNIYKDTHGVVAFLESDWISGSTTSRTLLTVHSILTGLKSHSVSTWLLLAISVTRALFHVDGTKPFIKQKFIRCVIVLRIYVYI